MDLGVKGILGVRKEEVTERDVWIERGRDMNRVWGQKACGAGSGLSQCRDRTV